MTACHGQGSEERRIIAALCNAGNSVFCMQHKGSKPSQGAAVPDFAFQTPDAHSHAHAAFVASRLSSYELPLWDRG